MSEVSLIYSHWFVFYEHMYAVPFYGARRTVCITTTT